MFQQQQQKGIAWCLALTLTSRRLLASLENILDDNQTVTITVMINSINTTLVLVAFRLVLLILTKEIYKN
jgi:hypothetical protein